MNYRSRKKAYILLADGTIFYGKSIGIEGTSYGEICFNTGMTGYQEIFTDPSYFGQIMVTTNAHIGNYGVLNDEAQSDIIAISGLICKNFSFSYSRVKSNNSLFEYLKKNKISPRYHIKFDTGMTRLGFDLKDADKVFNKINGEISSYIEGIYTHFATADEGDLSYAERQLKNFNTVIKKADEFGLSFKYIHCSNSGALLNIEKSYFNMVRVGMLLYGALPSNEVVDSIGIQPVMSFCGSIVNVRQVKKGTHISYGGVYKTLTDCNIAVVQTGFADGFPRPWHEKGYVCYKGNNFKIAGRVCMDQLMVDFGNTLPDLGDDVLFFGENQMGKIPVEVIADQIGSTPYVLLTAIGGRTKHIYID